jgi:hypothetical protein
VSGRDSFLVEGPRDVGKAAAARVLEADPVDDGLLQGRRSAGGNTLAGGPRWFEVLPEQSLEFEGGD